MKRLLVWMGVLSILLTGCGSTKESSWQEQYDLGMRCLSDGDYEGAILAFSAAIEIDSKRAPAYVGRGDAYVKSGEADENLVAALANYQKALEFGPRP